MRLFKHMPLLLAITGLTLALGCERGNGGDNGSELNSTGRPVGEIRGTALINKLLRTRLFDQTVPSTHTFEIEKIAGGEVYQMRGLLGQYAEGSASAEFRGGEPNPFGLLLWHQVTTRFAEGLAGFCAAPEGTKTVTFKDGTTATLTAGVAAKVKAVCAWPADATLQKQTATQLWRAVMGFTAADEETVWLALFTGEGSAFVAATPQARVEAMLVATLLNPHFLLEK